MKNLIYISLALLIMTSCNFNATCPTYSLQKKTKHGEKSQSKYAKTHNKKSYLSM